MRTAISSTESRVLPAGLRIRRHRRPAIWVGAASLAAAGPLLGTVLSGAPTSAIIGTAAVLVAAGTAIYWPALGLAILAFTYPYDLTAYAGPVKLTTSAVLMAILLVVLLGRRVWGGQWHWSSTELDYPVLGFASATLLSLLGLAGHWED